MAHHIPLSPGPTYNTFMNRAMDIPLLSEEEEQDLFRQLRMEQSEDARNHLFMANTRLVTHMAKVYRHYGLNIEDLAQEGFSGLSKAIEKYDADAGVRFGLYASMWIKAAIREYIIDNQHIVRIATTNAHKKLFFALRRYNRSGRWMSPEERAVVANELNVTDDQVRDMELRLATTQASILNSDPGDDFINDGSTVLHVADPSPTPEEIAERDQELRHLSDEVRAALSELSHQEQDIVRRRVLLPEGSRAPTLEMMGKEYGVSRERIRQVEAKAIKKLRVMLQHTQEPEAA